MTTALIIYGSTTGNTEAAAETIGSALRDRGVETKTLNVTDAGPGEIAGGHDLILLGCSTWGDEEIEFQDDFIPFYESMEDLPLEGRNVAVFGCGDSSYTYFCGAVDEIEKKAEAAGANIVSAPLKIDGDPGSAEDDIREWAGALDI